MLKVPQILVRAITLVAGAALLAGCGQKGPLFTPSEVASRQRATMMQSLRPAWTRGSDATAKPAAPPSPATPPTAVEAPPTQTDLVPESTLGQ